MSIFKKIRLVTLGNAEDLLDKMIDTNSPAALRQYARDMESSLDQLRNEAAVAAGQIRTLTREKTELEAEKAHVEEVITQLLQSSASNKDAVAKSQAQQLPSLASRIKATDDMLATQQQTSAQLDDAVRKLDAKHASVVNRIQELSILDRSTKAKEHAAALSQNLSRTVSAGSDISIDDVESRVRARADVADEKFSRAMGTFDQLTDPAESAEADKYLEQIKAKIGQPA